MQGTAVNKMGIQFPQVLFCMQPLGQRSGWDARRVRFCEHLRHMAIYMP